jgi:CheY-like chemotaxis protein
MAEAVATVMVIDDDPAIRESIGGLLRSVGLQAKLFASVDEFLKAGRPAGPACLVLDVRLSGRSGLDFQRERATANLQLPVISITGYGDIPISVRARSSSCGRPQWPSSIASASANEMPARTRISAVFSMPSFAAIWSAVRKPMPRMSRARRYGISEMMS